MTPRAEGFEYSKESGEFTPNPTHNARITTTLDNLKSYKLPKSPYL